MAVPQTKERARKCARVLAKLVRIGLGFALVVQLLLLGLILSRGELPVPRFLLESVHSKLGKEGLVIDWESLHVNLTGQVLVEDLRIGVAQGEHNTMFKAESALVRFSPLRAIIGQFRPSLFIVEGAELICPVLISPTGEAVTLIDEIALNLELDHKQWYIRQMQARLFNVQMRSGGNIPEKWLEGILQAARTEESGASATPAEKPRTLLVRYRDFSHLLYSQRETLMALDYPRVTLSLSHLETREASQRSAIDQAIKLLEGDDDDSTQQLVIDGSLGISSMFDETLQLRSGPVQTEFSFALSSDAALTVLSPPYSSASSINWKDKIHAGLMIAVFPRPDGAAQGIEGLEQLLKSPLDKLGIYAWDLNVYGFPLDHARVEMISADGSHLFNAQDFLVKASIQEAWNRLSAFGSLSRRWRNGSFDFIADWNPDYLKSVAPADLPADLHKELGGIHFKHTPHINGHLVLSRGFMPTWVGLRLRSGTVTYDNLNVVYSHAHAYWDGSEVVADGIVAHSADGFSATGRFWQSLETDAYMIWAEGTLNPSAINPFIPDAWWRELWADFSFNPQRWPQVSFAMAGVHNKGAEGKRIFVKAAIEDFSYRDIAATQANATLNMHEDRVDLHDFSIYTPEGEAHLNLRWQFDGHELKYLAFRGNGTLPIHDAAMLVGPQTVEDLKDFTAAQPPRAAMQGIITGDRHYGQDELLYMKLQLKSDYAVAYDWIHMDSINTLVTITPEAHVLPSLKGVLAGGQLEADVHIDRKTADTMPFAVNVSVRDAHLNRLEEALPILAGDDNDDDDDDGLLDQHGLVNFKGAITGTSGNMRSLNGSGTLDVRDSNLTEINLLGALSRLLSFLNMPIATLGFESAQMQWQMADGIVHLPKVQITGSTAKITASGNIDLETKQINFLIYLQPFGEVSFPVISQALWLLSPLSSIIQVQATGSLSDPEFSTSISPSAIFQGRQRMGPALPGSLEAPDASTISPPVMPPRRIDPVRAGRPR